jgi:hypothetical protein
MRLAKESFYYFAGLNKKKIKQFPCENAGEYGKIDNVFNKFAVTLEYVAPYTPQQNGIVETLLATELRMAQSIMEAADLTDGISIFLRNEAIMAATTMANISCNDISKKCHQGKNSMEIPHYSICKIQFNLAGWYISMIEERLRANWLPNP